MNVGIDQVTRDQVTLIFMFVEEEDRSISRDDMWKVAADAIGKPSEPLTGYFYGFENTVRGHMPSIPETLTEDMLSDVKYYIDFLKDEALADGETLSIDLKNVYYTRFADEKDGRTYGLAYCLMEL